MTELLTKAIRKKFRFTSPKGQLTMEDLWDLPLKGDISLNAVAQTLNKNLQEEGEMDFVNDSSTESATHRLLSDKMTIVLGVIEVKKNEASEAKSKQARNAERQEILAIMAEKSKESLKASSEATLKRRLRELDKAET